MTLLCFAPGFASIFTQIWPSFVDEITDEIPPFPSFDCEDSASCCVPRETLSFLDILPLLVVRLTTADFCTLLLHVRAKIVPDRLGEINAQEQGKHLWRVKLQQNLKFVRTSKIICTVELVSGLFCELGLVWGGGGENGLSKLSRTKTTGANFLSILLLMVLLLLR